MEFLFPYDSYRKVQKALMLQIAHAVSERIPFFAHAPTGLGKTISALGSLLPYALEKKKTLIFLTPMHSQHKIVIDTLRLIEEKYHKSLKVVDFIGKKWMCPVPGVQELGSSEFSSYCTEVRKKETCEYYTNYKDTVRKSLALES